MVWCFVLLLSVTDTKVCVFDRVFDSNFVIMKLEKISDDYFIAGITGAIFNSKQMCT